MRLEMLLLYNALFYSVLYKYCVPLKGMNNIRGLFVIFFVLLIINLRQKQLEN